MYSTDTNRYFISVNATFFKESSFFSSAKRPHVLDVLRIPLILPSPALPSPSTFFFFLIPRVSGPTYASPTNPSGPRSCRPSKKTKVG